MASALNGKASFVAATKFAGVTEITNWLIFYQDALETGPAAQLSFASQEASLGLWPGRPLHLFASVGAYLQFLRGQIERHARTDPVKAVKRAIPWLRLFGEATLLDDLLDRMRAEGAFACAGALARIELRARHAAPPACGAPKGWARMLRQLEDEIETLAAEALGRRVPADRIERTLTLRLRAITKRLDDKGAAESLWTRILAVAQTA